MVANKAKSGLASALGAKASKAFDSHKNDETVYSGGGDVPSGIENGVAQLVDCKFDTYKDGDNKGKYYFYAAGVVVSPKMFNGAPVEGLRTSIQEPLYDTPSRKRTTVEDHLSWVLNELRKLGLDTSELDFDDLETAAASLKETAPMFRFRTWSGQPTKEYPDPRTNHQWGGLVEFDAEVSEEVEEVEEEAEEEKPATKKPAAKKPQKETEKKNTSPKSEFDPKKADAGDENAQAAIIEVATEFGIDYESVATWGEVVDAIQEARASATEEEPEEETSEEETDEGEETENTKLGKQADEGDEESLNVLSERASRFEIDPDEYATWYDVGLALDIAEEENGEKYETEEESPVEGLGEKADEGDEEAQATLTEYCEQAEIDPDNYATWVEVEDLVKTYLKNSGESEEAAEEEFLPQKEEIYLWKPPKGKKQVECEVIAVDEKKKTVSLKDTTTKLIHKNVPFSDIAE